MWNGKKVSVVFGTYREKDSIRQAIEDFFATGLVDEIIVVNNNAERGTDEEVRKTMARLVHEERQGVGYSFQRGIQEAGGDYIVLAEPDGTDSSADLKNFLEVAADYQIVFGTRTNKKNIMEGAAMGELRRLANVLEGNIIEILFKTTHPVTDIGCHYKLMHREIAERFMPLWRERGALFPTEIILLATAHKIKSTEIPITFRKRIGKSSLTAHWYHLVKWGLYILGFIIVFWVCWVWSGLKKIWD